MITRNDLEMAIAECQGERNPNANTCIKLAAFLTIQRELYGDDEKIEHPSYSYSPAEVDDLIHIDSDSEFARIVNGQNQKDVLPVMDELMDTLNAIQPRLYNAVLDRLS